METNIVKETLNETLNQIRKDWSRRYTEIQEDLSNKLRSILNDEIFDNFDLKISKHQIEFLSKEKNGWYSFTIYRRSNWNKGTESYDSDIELNTSSGNGSDKVYLQKLCCLGILARDYYLQTDRWNNIIGLMDDALYFDKNEMEKFWEKTNKIEAQLKKIDIDTENDRLNSILNSGELKLKNEYKFYYGSGKYDRVWGVNFYFKLNPSGKTYTVEYDHKKRTNPYMDDEGKSLEPVYELVRCNLSNRIKVKDLHWLIKDNLKNII